MKPSEVLAIALLVGSAVGWVTYDRLTAPPKGTFAVDLPVTQFELRKLGARLKEAHARGDRSGLKGIYSDSARLMQLLNDPPASERPDMHNCRLAALHIIAGGVALGDGAPWMQEHQFDAALSACR